MSKAIYTISYDVMGEEALAAAREDASRRARRNSLKVKSKKISTKNSGSTNHTDPDAWARPIMNEIKEYMIIGKQYHRDDPALKQILTDRGYSKSSLGSIISRMHTAGILKRLGYGYWERVA